MPGTSNGAFPILNNESIWDLRQLRSLHFQSNPESVNPNWA